MFDWSLLDRKDSPYATFRFYYQPREALSKLGIISQPNGTGLTGRAEVLPGSTLASDPSDTSVSTFAQDPKRGTRCGHGDTCASCGIGVDSGWDVGQALTTSRAVTRPPELLESSPGSARKPQPSKQMRDGFLDGSNRRPLPALPILRHRAAAMCDRSEHTSPSSSVGEVRESNTTYESQTIEMVSNIQKGKQTHPSSSSGPTRFKHSALARTQPSAAGAAVPSSAAQGRDYTPARDRKQKTMRSLFFSAQRKGEPETAPAGDTAGQGATGLSQLPGVEGPGAVECEPGERVEHGTRTKQMCLINGKPEFSSLPRGLLGPDLTRIPLTGPSADLMKRLRSEDPFRGS